MAGPRVVHFVFGLRPQRRPFHLVHYLCLESCRQVLAPDTIMFHHDEVPYGAYWDRIRPHLTLRRIEAVPTLPAPEALDLVPDRFRYAHVADLIRLAVLIEHGGVYADMDTLFVRPYPASFYEHPFVIGRESPVLDEHTHVVRPSLCNAVLFSRPRSAFAMTWLGRMPGAMNGTWSNHSGFLSEELAGDMPDEVHIEDRRSFFHWEGRPGIRALFEDPHPPVTPTDLDGVHSVHLWAHLWWDRARTDFSLFHAGLLTERWVRASQTVYAQLARRFLPGTAIDD